MPFTIMDFIDVAVGVAVVVVQLFVLLLLLLFASFVLFCSFRRAACQNPVPVHYWR